jgi:ribosomal protein L22
VKSKAAQTRPARGALSSSSIFEDESIAGPITTSESAGVVRNPRNMAAALDPDPSSRERWERKMVIREITKRGRLTKAQELKRSERVSHSKSHNFLTSVKKLGPLARQITGKPLEEAIVQMRFSKKKAAQGVREHLVHARNEAVVRRGMGLGKEDGFRTVQIKTKDGKRMKIDDPSRLYVEQAWVGKGDYGITPDHRARGQINLMKNPSTRKSESRRMQSR